jgi:hypothetical protein
MQYPTKLLAKEWQQDDDPVGGIRDIWEEQQLQDLR